MLFFPNQNDFYKETFGGYLSRKTSFGLFFVVGLCLSIQKIANFAAYPNVLRLLGNKKSIHKVSHYL